jgi:hypothetical protein
MGGKSILRAASEWRAVRAALARLVLIAFVLQGMVAVHHTHADAGAIQSHAQAFVLEAGDGADAAPDHDGQQHKSEKNCPACLAASMGAQAMLASATVAWLPQTCTSELPQLDGHALEANHRHAVPIRAPPSTLNA